MKFLIIRTDKIGDVLLTLPIAVKLKEKNSTDQVIFLAQNYTQPLVKLCNSVDKVISVDEHNFLDLIEILRSEKIDVAIVARPTIKNALIPWMAGIKTRIGTKYRIYSFLFNKRVSHHRKYSVKHEALYNLDLIEPLGIQNLNNLENISFGITPSEEEQELLKRKLRKRGIDLSKKIVVFHIGSGGSSIDWNPVKFRELGINLLKRKDCELILTGSHKEFLLNYELFFDYREKVHNLAGDLDLKELFHLFSLADVYVGNSTGPTHLAAIAGTYVIAFYPKIKVASQIRWGPITKRRIIFEPEIDCLNCTQLQCKALKCMDSIQIEKVYWEIEKILNKVW